MDGTAAPHEHEFLEVTLVTGGTATYVSSDEGRQVRSGSAVIVPPGHSHGYVQCSDLVLFDCFVAPAFVTETLAFLDQPLPLLHAVHHAGVRVLPVPPIQLNSLEFNRCVAELHSITSVGPGKGRSLTQAVGHLLIYLDILDRAWQRQANSLVGRPQRHPVAVAAQRLIEAELAHPWTLGELASRLAVDRTHLVRVFHQATGVPPITYLNQCRAKRASSLLAHTDLPVSTVGLRVGWPDPTHFARRFRVFFGVSPTAFRNRALTGAHSQ
ncbi:helix-turn-helix domain-containing protein [Streptomyces sp. NPDC058001]|uniref:helix-turn-helix domain-containing protein n=1 Tax=Streptomyces sp. NPDC058001 TaxID=3346300 RepID=UPI0036EFB81E